MKGLPAPGFTLPLFGEIAQTWRAWQNGIPPQPGSYEEQSPNLLIAFAALDAAEANAERAARVAAPPAKG